MEQIDWIKELEKEQEEKEELVNWLEEVKHNPELFLKHFIRNMSYNPNRSSNWMDSVFKSLIKKQRS